MMPTDEGPGTRGYVIPALAPPPLDLLDQPIDYLLADHFRQRSLCAALQTIAENKQASRQIADAIVAFLMVDLDRHHLDEEDALFPALRRRLRPVDDLGVILARLIEDHRHTEAMREGIVEALARDPAADPVAVGQAAAELMVAFSGSERRHLAIENGIVMVIARKRLTADDLKAISRRMKMRRGIVG